MYVFWLSSKDGWEESTLLFTWNLFLSWVILVVTHTNYTFLVWGLIMRNSHWDTEALLPVKNELTLNVCNSVWWRTLLLTLSVVSELVGCVCTFDFLCVSIDKKPMNIILRFPCCCWSPQCLWLWLCAKTGILVHFAKVWSAWHFDWSVAFFSWWDGCYTLV